MFSAFPAHDPYCARSAGLLFLMVMWQKSLVEQLESHVLSSIAGLQPSFATPSPRKSWGCWAYPQLEFWLTKDAVLGSTEQYLDVWLL